MGISSASEIFQHVIQTKVLRGPKGTRNLADDIIVYGKTREEHDKRLGALCTRLDECGLTISRKNCTLGATEIEFFGLRLSNDGVALNESKIEALQKAGTPRTASEVNSLLGLVTYCNAFIPDAATSAAPLWDLVKKDVTFKWEPKHDEALERIKDTLVTHALGFFNVTWTTEVTFDASPVGLSAVCAQINPARQSERKIITYARRSLTQVERRYRQCEKEALAIVWGCEKLELYLAGTWFSQSRD